MTPGRTLASVIVSAGGLASLGACGAPPVVGGPCAYETTIMNGTVIQANGDAALFETETGEMYIPAAYLDPVPLVGETLTIRRDRITEGTCTPEVFSVVREDATK